MRGEPAWGASLTITLSEGVHAIQGVVSERADRGKTWVQVGVVAGQDIVLVNLFELRLEEG